MRILRRLLVTIATGDRRNGADGGRLQYRAREARPRHDREDEDDDEDDDRREGRRRDRFVSRTLAPVIFWDDPGVTPGPARQATMDTVAFTGTGQWNRQPGYTFEARAQDAGEPGRGHDTFAITIRDPGGAVVATVSGPLSAGNIQSLPVKPLR